jgi:hypothetical protein
MSVKQPNQFTIRSKIHKKAKAQRDKIESEIQELQGELNKRLFALEQINEVIAEAEGEENEEQQTSPATHLLRAVKLGPVRSPVRPAPKSSAAKLAGKKRAAKKKEAKK